MEVKNKSKRRRRRRPLIYAILVIIIGMSLWIHGRYDMGRKEQTLLTGSFAVFVQEKNLKGIIEADKLEDIADKGDGTVSFVLKLKVNDPKRLNAMIVKLERFPFRGAMFDKYARTSDFGFIKNTDVHATALIVRDGMNTWLIGDNWRL
ncbi:MAG: hypothetical protein JXR78_01210 [Victivallales bacterium]|nr:hypothetical protein [Victivallales bacterium]